MNWWKFRPAVLQTKAIGFEIGPFQALKMKTASLSWHRKKKTTTKNRVKVTAFPSAHIGNSNGIF